MKSNKTLSILAVICLLVILVFKISNYRNRSSNENIINTALQYSPHSQPANKQNPKYGNYLYMHHFYGNLAIVKLNGLEGLLDTMTLKEVLPCKYYVIYEIKDKYSTVICNKKYGKINEKGEVVIPVKYDFLFDFGEGLAAAKLNHNYGYINEKGQEVIPIKYDMAWEFNDGLAAVKLNNNWGFINKQGKVVIPFQYYYVDRSFKEGKAFVSKGLKTFCINKKGKILADEKLPVNDEK